MSGKARQRQNTEIGNPVAGFATSDRAAFADRLLDWFDRHGRHDLPWQHPRTVYRVWVAEVMLQQTQVATVIPYYQRFMQAFPSLPALADAGLDRVLALWSGLGYYARARHLHQAAGICCERHDSDLPHDFTALADLPGIGRSTAGAILAQTYGDRFAILDGNVKRVLCRFHGINGWPGAAPVQRALWTLAETHLPTGRLADYTQAIMDLGATVCTRTQPACRICPLQDDCFARIHQTWAELPTSRPGKPLPQREAVVIAVYNEAGEVLLEKRPPIGVWAGLWSLPEYTDRNAAQAWLHDHLVNGFSVQSLPPVAHGFSHYRLTLNPLRVNFARLHPRVAEAPPRQWVAVEDLPSLGLPAPIRRLLLI